MYHHRTIKYKEIDSTGCFSFAGHKYEASAALGGCTVEISYDPMNIETITVNYNGMDPIMAKRVRIGAFADKKPEKPVGMTARPETSRFLDALEKKYKEDHRMMADALSFGEYGKEGGGDV